MLILILKFCLCARHCRILRSCYTSLLAVTTRPVGEPAAAPLEAKSEAEKDHQAAFKGVIQSPWFCPAKALTTNATHAWILCPIFPKRMELAEPDSGILACFEGIASFFVPAPCSCAVSTGPVWETWPLGASRQNAKPKNNHKPAGYQLITFCHAPARPYRLIGL